MTDESTPSTNSPTPIVNQYGVRSGTLTPDLTLAPDFNSDQGCSMGNGPMLPLVAWPDIYKPSLDYLEYVSPVFRESPIWGALIEAYGKMDTSLSYRPAVGLSRTKDPNQNQEDAQLSAWGLASAGFSPENLLGFKDFFPRLRTYWGQYVKDRGTSVSFTGFIEWAFNMVITYVPLSIAKEDKEDVSVSTYFVSKTALAGSREITVNPPLDNVQYAYVIQLTTGREIPASVLMQTKDGTVLHLAYPLESILLENRELVIKEVKRDPSSRLDINTLRPAAHGGQSPEGPYYPSPYYDVYFRPREGTPPLSYSQLVEVLLYLKPIYLVQRRVSELYLSTETLSLSSALAYYKNEMQVFVSTTSGSVNNRRSTDAFRFWINSSYHMQDGQ